MGVGFPPFFTVIQLGDTEGSGDAAELNSAAVFTQEKGELLLFAGEEEGGNLLVSKAHDPSSLWLGKREKIDSEG